MDPGDAFRAIRKALLDSEDKMKSMTGTLCMLAEKSRVSAKAFAEGMEEANIVANGNATVCAPLA